MLRLAGAIGALLLVIGALVALSGESTSGADESVRSTRTASEEPNPTNTTRVPDVTSTVPGWTEDLERRLESASSPLIGISDEVDALVVPGESIQGVVDELPPGSTISIASGVHFQQQVTPKAGMTFVGVPGAIMDGQNETNYAFVAFEEDDADNVTIRGIEIRNYVPAFEPHGAIMSNEVSGWLVLDCEVHDTAYAGVYVGANSSIRESYVHNNGRIGLKAKGENVLIEGNQIAFNNPDDLHDPLWEAGGFKFIETDGLVARGNHIHDNHGSGIWADLGAINTVIEENLIEGNTHAGIDYEISSHGIIRNNVVRNNGHGHASGWMWGAGITIRGPHVYVHGNVVRENRNGIVLIQTDRGSAYELGGVAVVDNLIVNSGQNGAARSSGPFQLFDTSMFDHNEYQYDDFSAKWWHWDDLIMTWDQWTSAGNDPNGELGS